MGVGQGTASACGKQGLCPLGSIEKDISYLPEYKDADHPFEGLLDRVTMRVTQPILRFKH